MGSRRERREARKAAQLEKQKQRLAKVEIEPNPQKSPRAIEPEDFEEQKVQWCFELFDAQTDWRVNKNNDHDGFCYVAEHLKTYSEKTWKEIRQNRDRDHPSLISDLCKEARERLQDLKLDDIDELWRFRFSGARRIWGIRDGRLFKVIWWDPDHKVWPTPRQ